ncbi:MAG: peptidylprolyl isomerase [Patescibacteria group bacterium]
MPSSNRSYVWPVLGGIVGIYLLLLSLPDTLKAWAPAFLRPALHLGLDLQGGTQLDFRISEAEMEQQIRALRAEIEALEGSDVDSLDIEEKRAQLRNIELLRGGIVEAIRTVLERRVNSLGVSEAVITPSFFGDEKHLLVECPGVIDIQKCIATVGKTILLEFKEQATGTDEDQIAKMRALAAEAEKRITGSGESLKTISDDLGSTLGVAAAEVPFYRDELPKGLEALWERSEGDPVIHQEVELSPVLRDDKLIAHHGIFFAEATGPKETTDRALQDPEVTMAYLTESDANLTFTKHEKTEFPKLDDGYEKALAELQPNTLVKGIKADGAKSILFVRGRIDEKEELSTSHILVSYKGAARAESSMTRTKEQAQTRAAELRARLDKGANFATLAHAESDGESAAESGKLGFIARGVMPASFDQAAFALKRVGEITGPIETEFGFHIIRLDAPLKKTPGTLTFGELVMKGEDAEKRQTELLEKLQKREVTKKEEQLPLRTLFFSFLPTGWKDTALDGKHFRRATVTSARSAST